MDRAEALKQLLKPHRTDQALERTVSSDADDELGRFVGFFSFGSICMHLLTTLKKTLLVFKLIAVLSIYMSRIPGWNV
jgi:hypothetical protein